MTKKNKIFDVIFFKGEVYELQFRLKELNDYVDKFIIVDCGENKIEIWGEKIVYFESEVLSESTFDNINNKLREVLVSLNLDFEDMLIFSECNEIPDFDYYDKFLNNIDYSPFFINHTVFHWDKHYYSKVKKLGSLISNFSYFLQPLTNVNAYFTNKNNVLFGDPDAIDCGWKFINFYLQKTDENKILIDEMLECCDDDPVKSNPLIKLRGDEKLPKNFDSLPNKFKKRSSVKKHLIIVESTNEESLEDFDNISYINFSNVFPEVFGTTSTLYLPDRVLYGQKNYDDFIDDYKLNDTKRIIHTLFPQDQDIIHIRFNSSEYSFNWGEWKDKNLCEIKNPS